MGGMTKTLWLFNDRLSFSAQYCPMWEKPMYKVYENGGREPNECLDVNLHFWKLAFSMTLWNIGKWSRLLRMWKPSK